MLNQLLNTVINILVILGLVWLGLALASARWHSLKPWYRGYLTLLRVFFVGIARWLWSPEFSREGGGQVAQQRPSLKEDEWT